VGVFKASYDAYGGEEDLAKSIGEAVNSRVFTIVGVKKNVHGFVDISSDIPAIARIVRMRREFDYLTWSCVDISNYGDFDVVVTIGQTARALITPDDVLHVHMLVTPIRRLYDLYHYERRNKNFIKSNFILPLVSEFLRIWDVSVDNRVDYYISISPVVQLRLWKYLKRKSVVIYPPIKFEKYRSNSPEDYYLYICRLEPPKRPVEAIEGCIRAKKKIVVVGTGSLESEIIKKYKNNKYVELKGYVDEKVKIDLLSRCKAVIYPCLAEDFGIVPIEAFASGKPVIADATGFPKYIVDSTRGIITDCSCPDNISKAIEIIETKEYDPDKIKKFAKNFDFSIFKKKLVSQLREWYELFSRGSFI